MFAIVVRMKHTMVWLALTALLISACAGTKMTDSPSASPVATPSASIASIPSADPVAGFGEDVGVVSCDFGGHDSAYHIHAQLTVILPDGTNAEVPANIGVGTKCMYWLHTHQPNGKLHVEAPSQTNATLANFLEIWRRSANPAIPDAVAAGLAEIHVNGTLVASADSVVLQDGLVIEIAVKSFPKE